MKKPVLARAARRAAPRTSSYPREAPCRAARARLSGLEPPSCSTTGCSSGEKPMIDVTDRHFRFLVRCISPLPTLWTEMTWDRAILYNTPDQPEFAVKKTELDRSLESIIGFSEEEHPLVCQLGGCDPDMLARSARRWLDSKLCCPLRCWRTSRFTSGKNITQFAHT